MPEPGEIVYLRKDPLNCYACRGRGQILLSRFGRRRPCSRCNGRGLEPDTPWAKLQQSEEPKPKLDSSRRLWFVGQYRCGEVAQAIRWDFQGVFTTIEKAIAACRDHNYFIWSGYLNHESPHEPTPMVDCLYPIDAPLESQ